MENTFITTSIVDYSTLLNAYGVEYTVAGSYWQIGKINKPQGWIIHLSVIEPQIQNLLEMIIPWLIERHLPFKIVLSESIASDMLSGSLGSHQIGKIVSIYPENDSEAISCAKDLIKITSRFHGPAIPTDRYLGGTVYTRYGSFNPILIANDTGQLLKCIYDADGRLTLDPYTIPFSLPKGIDWPFSEMAEPQLSKEPKLLNHRYYPLFIIKPDAKGNVIKALYFEKFWRIRSCIIKQGHPYMVVDQGGRDIRDKLKWQFELYQKLRKEVAMPKVFDFFTSQSGDVYLVMEYIKGPLLSGWIQQIYSNRCWLHLPQKERLMLLDKLLEILNTIKRMHTCGFIHRDITSDNFIMDKKGNIFLIDMELAWSISDNYPTPPFRVGTPGYMSPEQENSKTPTVQEDIYGLGGLMTIFFTNIHPLKFRYQDVEQRRNSIYFFTGEYILAEVISDCHHSSPGKRPTLSEIQNKIHLYRNLLSSPRKQNSENNQLSVDKPQVEAIVKAGISGLALPQFLNHKSRWISRAQTREKNIGNDQLEITLSEGWHTGMSGPLWLIGCAKRYGWAVEDCIIPYKQSWDYLQAHYFPHLANNPPGLYFGSAGVACAIIQGLNSGLLLPTEKIIRQLHDCFKDNTDLLSLTSGIAGQGIALLQTDAWLEKKYKIHLLETYVAALLEKQLSDGSWITEYNLGKPGDRITGMDYGISGILLFLLNYIKEYPDDNVRISILKCLRWLMSNKSKKISYSAWSMGTGSRALNIPGFSHGVAGIALVFIKAYEILKDPQYKIIAEEVLINLPAFPSQMDFSFSSGLVGLGETYLEAFNIFKTQEWQKRSDWIANLLLHSYTQFEKHVCYWTLDYTMLATADLFTGNSSILRFLIRFLNPKIITHPISK